MYKPGRIYWAYSLSRGVQNRGIYWAYSQPRGVQNRGAYSQSRGVQNRRIYWPTHSLGVYKTEGDILGLLPV